MGRTDVLKVSCKNRSIAFRYHSTDFVRAGWCADVPQLMMRRIERKQWPCCFAASDIRTQKHVIR